MHDIFDRLIHRIGQALTWASPDSVFTSAASVAIAKLSLASDPFVEGFGIGIFTARITGPRAAADSRTRQKPETDRRRAFSSKD